MINDHFEIYGPANQTVEAWAADYLRHQVKNSPPWQEDLTTAIKTRCGNLRPGDGQVLRATFFGQKDEKVDVENLVLYNIGSFGDAGSNGILFEYGAGIPLAPSGAGHPFCYRYELAGRRKGFSDWQVGLPLARFDWTDLGELSGDKLLAPVWLALARAHERSEAETFPVHFAPGAAFAVRLRIRPPHQHTRVLGNMVKGIVDGVVSAFQSHTDMKVLPKVIPPLALTIEKARPAGKADPAELERHFRQCGRGVLGPVWQLVSPSGGGGVIWRPDDHLCVAGELIRADSHHDRHWAIKGDVISVSRRDQK